MWSLSMQEAWFVQRRSPLLNCNKNCPYRLQTAYFTDSSAVSINSTFPPSAILFSFLGHEQKKSSMGTEDDLGCQHAAVMSSQTLLHLVLLPLFAYFISWYIVDSGHSYLFPSSSSVKYICLFPHHSINHSTRYIIGSATSRLRAHFDSVSLLVMIQRQVQCSFCGLEIEMLDPLATEGLCLSWTRF